jgi:lipid-A-disaccharide synthase
MRKVRKSPATPTILITAGEASGDRLGAALMAALKKHRKHLRFIGVGGPQMQKHGLVSAFPMSDLAVMGLAEVIPSIPRILARIRQLKALAVAEKPNLIITIDSQDFSKRLATALHGTAPHLHYVAPKVWAWRQGRVHKLKKLYTHLLTNLPFEGKFFKNAGIPTTYVGHPALTTLAPYHYTPPKTPTLALLPGSRKSELKRHWPLFLAAYRNLKALQPSLTAVLTLPDASALATCKALAPWKASDAITPILGEARFKALASATAALSKSGTNNLELALLGTPAVVCYRMNALSYAIAKRLVKIPLVSLPNIILEEQVYPEFIQSAATPTTLARALQPLLQNPAARKHQQTLLLKLKTLMQTPQPPAEQAADIALKLLEKSR